MKYTARVTLFIIFLSLCMPFSVFTQQSGQRILIGILPEMNVFKQKQRFRLIGEYLSQKTGMNVEFTILSRYGNIIERFKIEKMDGAFFGSFTGALAIIKLGVIPLARPINLDNTSTYKGYIFARKNSGIRTVKDMKGKRMVFVEKSTTAGYIYPLAYLKENEITDMDRFFSDYFFAGSHDAAINAVLNRKADIGAAKHSIYDRIRKEDSRVDKELIILAESLSVPSNGLCVRNGLEASLQKKLRDALLSLHTDPEGAGVLKEFGALKFVLTTVGDYQSVYAMVKKAGIDINTYDYRNN